MRRGATDRAECLGHKQPLPRRPSARPDPSFILQFCEIDSSPSSPRTFFARDDAHSIIEQDLYIQIIVDLVAGNRSRQSRQNKIERTLMKLREFRGIGQLRDMKVDPRIALAELFDHWMKDGLGEPLLAPDAQFAGRRVGQILQRLNALPQLVKHGQAAFEQSVAINRWLDSRRTAIEQADTNGSFEIADCFRDGGWVTWRCVAAFAMLRRSATTDKM